MMLTFVRVTFACLITNCLVYLAVIVPAQAQDGKRYDGISVGQLSAALNRVKDEHGLAIEAKSTEAGAPYLLIRVPGTPLIFTAAGIDCAELGGRCSGFMYVFGDVGYVASRDFVLVYNNSSFFAKVVALQAGTILRFEVLADGGITDKLIDRSLLNLAVRLNNYRDLKTKGAFSSDSPTKPTADPVLNLGARGGFASGFADWAMSGAPNMPVRPAPPVHNGLVSEELIDKAARPTPAR